MELERSLQVQRWQEGASRDSFVPDLHPLFDPKVSYKDHDLIPKDLHISLVTPSASTSGFAMTPEEASSDGAMELARNQYDKIYTQITELQEELSKMREMIYGRERRSESREDRRESRYSNKDYRALTSVESTNSHSSNSVHSPRQNNSQVVPSTVGRISPAITNLPKASGDLHATGNNINITADAKNFSLRRMLSNLSVSRSQTPSTAVTIIRRPSDALPGPRDSIPPHTIPSQDIDLQAPKNLQCSATITGSVTRSAGWRNPQDVSSLPFPPPQQQQQRQLAYKQSLNKFDGDTPPTITSTRPNHYHLPTRSSSLRQPTTKPSDTIDKGPYDRFWARHDIYGKTEPITDFAAGKRSLRPSMSILRMKKDRYQIQQPEVIDRSVRT